MSEKMDLRKAEKHLYTPAQQVEVIDVPVLNFLMLDGRGDPNTAEEYRQAVEALYGLAYAVKFASKKAGLDYVVMPLEGLWWMDKMGEKYGDIDFAADKDQWQWTMMIRQPDAITAESVEMVMAEVRRKKDLPALDKIRLEQFKEGLAAQVLHIGAYSDEKPTIDRLHAFIDAQGYQPTGKHHEIYLGDPRRAAPEKLRTIIRQPMKR